MSLILTSWEANNGGGRERMFEESYMTSEDTEQVSVEEYEVVIRFEGTQHYRVLAPDPDTARAKAGAHLGQQYNSIFSDGIRILSVKTNKMLTGYKLLEDVRRAK